MSKDCPTPYLCCDLCAYVQETVEVHKHSNCSINKKKESLVLNKYWIPALGHGKIAGSVKKESNAISQIITNRQWIQFDTLENFVNRSASVG